MMTIFRNRFTGTDDDLEEDSQTVPIHIYHYWRYLNVIGNVLGDGLTQINYECAPTSGNSTGCGGLGNQSIYTLGWSWNGGSKYPTMQNDLNAKLTLMRWGNYDTVTDSVHWDSAEVPSGIGLYANAVPSSQDLPTSFYLASKPAWFGAVAWPAIGPDVIGGNLGGVEGFANKIPARLCYESTAKVGFVLQFNADACYASTGVLPNPPSNVVVQ
jgi:hypothetical protein